MKQKSHLKKREAGSLKRNLYLILIGTATGAVNGLFGGGGGMIVIPALTHVLKMPVKEAHATAILIILPITVISGAVYFFQGDYSLFVLVPCAIGFTLGGALGAAILKKISSPLVSAIFAAVMFLAGIRMIF